MPPSPPKTVPKSKSLGSPRACEKWSCPPNGGNSILTIICYTSGTSEPPKSNDFGPLWDPQIDAKIGTRNRRPKKLQKTSPKATKKGCQRALRGYLGSPKVLVVASNPLHRRCLASSLLCKRWRQGGGGVDDLATTCRRPAHDLPTTCRREYPASQLPPGPSLETAEEQNKILERQHNKNREGGKA